MSNTGTEAARVIGLYISTDGVELETVMSLNIDETAPPVTEGGSNPSASIDRQPAEAAPVYDVILTSSTSAAAVLPAAEAACRLVIEGVEPADYVGFGFSVGSVAMQGVRTQLLGSGHPPRRSKPTGHALGALGPYHIWRLDRVRR